MGGIAFDVSGSDANINKGPDTNINVYNKTGEGAHGKLGIIIDCGVTVGFYCTIDDFFHGEATAVAT